MSKIIIKFFINFGPIILFLTFYYYFEKKIIIALYPLIIGSLISTVANWYYEKKIAFIPLFGSLIICLFGGLSIYFNDPIFIYMRPTIIHILIGVFLLFGNKFLNEIPIKKLLGKIIKMEKRGWIILNHRFVFLVFFMALLNEIIWRSQSEEIWINFKVWGGSLITFIYCLYQTKLINTFKIKKKF